MSSDDPAEVNPGLYRVVFEDERVRVLEYLGVTSTEVVSTE